MMETGMLMILAVEGLISIGVIVGALWWISEQHGAHDKDIHRVVSLIESLQGQTKAQQEQSQEQIKALRITVESIRTMLQSFPAFQSAGSKKSEDAKS